MKEYIPENLTKLAKLCPFPLYVVGGSVRDYLAGLPLKPDADWDISAPGSEDDLMRFAEQAGFAVKSVYKNTGTVKLKDKNGAEVEFTRFRSDKYVRGIHAPAAVEFTDDMQKDARRRDFCADAVYYDIQKETFADPLNGTEDIKKRILRTVAPADKVFGEDGLRLMRLARLSAETGFLPDEECYAGATKHAALICDIAPERIFSELSRLLLADGKQSDPEAPYRGLCVLRDTKVLKEVLPELALGEGLVQRADFHNHDVLEHSFRCVRYAPPSIRFAALLHDVGKPFCFYRDGNFHCHAEEGARIAKEILSRLKAPKKLIVDTGMLVALHMKDFNLSMRENKIRRTLAKNHALIEPLFALFQADFSACKDNLSEAPTVKKWREVLHKMQTEHAPLSQSDLAVNGNDLLKAGIPPAKIGEALKELFGFALLDGSRNEKTILLKYASKHFSGEQS